MKRCYNVWSHVRRIEYYTSERRIRTCEVQRYKLRPGLAICRTRAPASRRWALKRCSAWYKASCRYFRPGSGESSCDLRAFRIPSVRTRVRGKRSHFVSGTFLQSAFGTFFVERAERLDHPRQAGLLLREFASTLVSTEQIPTLHQRQARAAFAVAPDLASRTDRKLALANRAQAFEFRRVIPDIFEFLCPQISRRLRQLDTRKNISVRRNVTAVVARTARQVFVSRALDSARNGAPKCRLEGVHGAYRLGVICGLQECSTGSRNTGSSEETDARCSNGPPEPSRERPLTWRPVPSNCSSIPSCEHADAGKTGVISLLASPWGREAVVVLRVHLPLSQACFAKSSSGKKAGTPSSAR